MSKNIGLKMDPDSYERLTQFVEKHYQGNKSLMIKLAIDEYIKNYETEDDDRFQKIENELETIKTDILELKNSLRGLIAQRET